MILYFLRKHFGDKEDLVTPFEPLKLDTDERELEAIFNKPDCRGRDFGRETHETHPVFPGERA